MILIDVVSVVYVADFQQVYEFVLSSLFLT